MMTFDFSIALDSRVVCSYSFIHHKMFVIFEFTLL